MGPALRFEAALAARANPDPDDPRPVTLVRPSAIFSARNHSTPLALPIGVTSLAGTLLAAGYRVQVVDAVGLGMDVVRRSPDGRFKVQGLLHEEVVERVDPATDVIGVSVMFSQEWPHVRALVRALRARLPGATLILGGEAVSALPEFTLRDCPEADGLVRGEGERPLLELVHRLRTGQPPGDALAAVAGCMRLEGDAVVAGPPPERIDEVEALPWPAWETIDVEPYFRLNFTLGLPRGRNMPLVGTRGCPYRCTFCSSPSMWTTRYRMRPVADVVDEIEHHARTYGANSAEFYDLTAIVRSEWVLELTRELERRGLDVSWQLPAGTRSEALDAEVLSAAASTGLEFVCYAPESGSERILEAIEKKVSLPRMLASIAEAKRAGLLVKVNMIFGFPDERRADVLRSMRFMWKLARMGVDDCNATMFSPYPGSALYEELRREGRLAALDDGYFEGLMTQYDLTLGTTYGRHLGSRELVLYRLLAIAGFYGLYYLRRPGRLPGLVATLLLGRGTDRPTSMFEQRLRDARVRRRQARAGAAVRANAGSPAPGPSPA